MTFTDPSGPKACAVCSGKGWLPIRFDSLPIPGWTEMLCPACGGNGETADDQPLPDSAEAA
jgi:DnaJ-class molecular chaperone